MKLILLFAMIWCHIIDDYKLQGILASMKQRQWWQDHAPADLYRNDYIIALYEHAFMWSFTTTLPLLIVAFKTSNHALFILLIISYIINTIYHAHVDNLKANKLKINLIQDQLRHLIQIVITWILALIVI